MAKKEDKRSGKGNETENNKTGKTKKTTARVKKPSKGEGISGKETKAISKEPAKGKKGSAPKAPGVTPETLPAPSAPKAAAGTGESQATRKGTKKKTTGSTAATGAKKSREQKSDPASKVLKAGKQPRKLPKADEDSGTKSASAKKSAAGKDIKKEPGKKTSSAASAKKAGAKEKVTAAAALRANQEEVKKAKDSKKTKATGKKKTAAKKSRAEKDFTAPSAKDLEEVAKRTMELGKKILPEPGEIKEAADALKEGAKTAKKVAGELIPDTDSLQEKAKEMIPDKEDLKSMVKDLSSMKSSFSLLNDYDIHLFREGKHFHLYKKLGSHLIDYNGETGVYFALWAPNAKAVSLIGDFNEWTRGKHPMRSRSDDSGIWEAFLPEAGKGSLYKYFIESNNGYQVEKGDPFAAMWETPPRTASIVWDLEKKWKDHQWLADRKEKARQPKPFSVYEIHLGSWRRKPEEDHRSLSYKEMAEQLPSYLKELGFTHVEFMPVMEHPFFGSWGYQVTGYFAPSSRYGTPQDFMDLIDTLHREGIGVILDWVPSHFPNDQHGLHYFDGTFLYEHEDPRKGYHPDWNSYIFNYGRNEVRCFLISNALFWLDRYHADGLRVDAVASMLYLDYSRKEGEWQPNEEGGRENLEALAFLKEFNEVVYREFPDVVTIAEESTSWPMVSRPTYLGGLGFGQKWMMGWMHDTLDYFQKDPVHRKHHQDTITFSTYYAFSENFMLPLSHDEVVYGKQSLVYKMPGDDWNKFANLRSLYAYMFAHPGTKLLFMGSEFAQTSEWKHDLSLEWHLTGYEPHQKMQETIKRLNQLYTTENALYEFSFEEVGFQWIDIEDRENSVISFLRKGKDPNDRILVVCNFTPVPRDNYRLGVPLTGRWREIFNSDAAEFGGSDVVNPKAIEATDIKSHGREHSLNLRLPPLGVVYLKPDKKTEATG